MILSGDPISPLSAFNFIAITLVLPPSSMICNTLFCIDQDSPDAAQTFSRQVLPGPI